jgi:ribosomal protein S18 acetylase RimI-like enzyme
MDIKPLTADTLDDLYRCDASFLVEAELHLHAESGQIRTTLHPVTPYVKSYPPDELDPVSYADSPDKAGFLAYVDGESAGQILLREYWNGYAYVDDIRVDARYRRGGVGRALMAAGIAWAKARGLPGIMLETQNNNVAACAFYERCGFVLAGFDNYLYRGIDRATREVALYWYLEL